MPEVQQITIKYMPVNPEQKLERIFEFLRGISPSQFAWLKELQKTEFSATEPERDARHIMQAGIAEGIRSSTVMYLVEDALTSRGIEFDAKKLNDQRHGAKQHYESLGTQQWPAPPPLVVSLRGKPIGPNNS
jgi:hypothetical protein